MKLLCQSVERTLKMLLHSSFAAHLLFAFLPYVLPFNLCNNRCRREFSRCQGCQYAAWSPDSQYLAVSSDSQKAVAVWRIRLKHENALDPDVLGEAVYRKLCAGNASQLAALKEMLMECNWKQLDEGIQAAQAERAACSTAQEKQQGAGTIGASTSAAAFEAEVPDPFAVLQEERRSRLPEEVWSPEVPCHVKWQ
jgi:hypothetical protein